MISSLIHWFFKSLLLSLHICEFSIFLPVTDSWFHTIVVRKMLPCLSIAVLAVSGLSCFCRASSCSASLCLVVVQAQWSQCTGSVAPWHVGSEFPDQGSNLHRLYCKANSLLDHQGSLSFILNTFSKTCFLA